MRRGRIRRHCASSSTRHRTPEPAVAHADPRPVVRIGVRQDAARRVVPPRPRRRRRSRTGSMIRRSWRRVEFSAGLDSFGALDFDAATDHFARCGSSAARGPRLADRGIRAGPTAVDPVESRTARTRRGGGCRRGTPQPRPRLVGRVLVGGRHPHRDRGGPRPAGSRRATARPMRKAPPDAPSQSVRWASGGQPSRTPQTLLGDTKGAHQTLDEWRHARIQRPPLVSVRWWMPSHITRFGVVTLAPTFHP